MAEHILITGGAGFVGSALALRLRRDLPECRITAFDNLYRRGSELNLARLKAAGVRFRHGDVRCRADIFAIEPTPTTVIHAAAEPSVHAGYDGGPAHLINTNLDGTVNCLELARAAKAAFVFVSTSRIYPFAHVNSLRFEEHETRFALTDPQVTPGASSAGIAETFPLDGARSLYGMTKFASELMVEEYACAFGLRFIIIRLGLLAGPWQMMKADQGVVTLWLAAHEFRRRLTYTGFGGTGKQVRDVLHIDDFTDLLMDMHNHFDDYCGQLFNVGGGAACSLSLCEASSLCRSMTGNELSIDSEPSTHLNDVRIYISDNTRVSSVHGWKPKRTAESILLDTLKWIRGNAPVLEGVFFQ